MAPKKNTRQVKSTDPISDDETLISEEDEVVEIKTKAKANKPAAKKSAKPVLADTDSESDDEPVKKAPAKKVDTKKEKGDKKSKKSTKADSDDDDDDDDEEDEKSKKSKKSTKASNEDEKSKKSKKSTKVDNDAEKKKSKKTADSDDDEEDQPKKSNKSAKSTKSTKAEKEKPELTKEDKKLLEDKDYDASKGYKKAITKYSEFSTQEMKKIREQHPNIKTQLPMKIAASRWKLYKAHTGLDKEEPSKKSTAKASSSKKAPAKKSSSKKTVVDSDNEDDEENEENEDNEDNEDKNDNDVPSDESDVESD